MNISAIIAMFRTSILRLFHIYKANILHITYVYLINSCEIAINSELVFCFFFIRFSSIYSDYPYVSYSNSMYLPVILGEL